MTVFDRYRSALLDIRQAHVPDQPAISGADEVSWVMQHVARIRKIASDALDAGPDENPKLRLCGFCNSWNSRPCGEQCRWLPTDPIFEELNS